MWRVVSVVFVALLFAGCFEQKKELAKKNDELMERKQRIEARLLAAKEAADKEKELLLTKMQERIEKLALERAKSEKEKEIELAKIKMEQALALSRLEQKYKLEELRLREQKERIELENERLIAQKELEVKKQFLIYSLIALVLIVIAILIILYIYKKRKDKLIAYHDNLEKYFRMKENEAKIAIANKIIDTIAEGKLTPEQEQRFLGVLRGDVKELPKELEERRGDEPIEAEIDDGKR
jgi:hypothetical protein